jgi:hypothetical protein
MTARHKPPKDMDLGGLSLQCSEAGYAAAEARGQSGAGESRAEESIPGVYG